MNFRALQHYGTRRAKQHKTAELSHLSTLNKSSIKIQSNLLSSVKSLHCHRSRAWSGLQKMKPADRRTESQQRQQTLCCHLGFMMSENWLKLQIPQPLNSFKLQVIYWDSQLLWSPPVGLLNPPGKPGENWNTNWSSQWDSLKGSSAVPAAPPGAVPPLSPIPQHSMPAHSAGLAF